MSDGVDGVRWCRWRVRNGVHGGRWCRWRVSDGVDGVRFSTRCSSDSEVGQLSRTGGSNDLSPHIPPFSLPLTLRTHRSKHLACSVPWTPVSDRLPDPISPTPLPHHFIQPLTLPRLSPPRRIKFTITTRSNFVSAELLCAQPFCSR